MSEIVQMQWKDPKGGPLLGRYRLLFKTWKNGVQIGDVICLRSPANESRVERLLQQFKKDWDL